jgi:RNA polymerase sigma-70 factor (ECF subfamily)
VTVASRDDVYLEHRRALFGLAYRMLGSVEDAQDVVSETYLRWQRVERPRDDRAVLWSIASRLCIDALRSAQRSRVDYVGVWLPEPLVEEDADPAEEVGRRETLSLAFLHLLERLTPVERAVFVLHEAFDYPAGEIAAMLELSRDNVRQILHRARKRLEPDRPRYRADRAPQRRLVEQFLTACATGEIEPLTALLADDVVIYADGGGKASAVLRPVQGRLRVARFVRGLVRHSPPGLQVDVVEANGGAALLLRVGEECLGLYALTADPSGARIGAIHAIRNPDKLARLAAGR